MKKTIQRIALLMLALLMAFSQIVLAEPTDNIKAIYDALIAEGSYFNDIAAIYAEYMEGAVLAATLEDDGITITFTIDDELYSSWHFVQDGDWLTATMEADDTDGVDMAGLILLASVSAHGRDPFLFDGYVSIHEELDSKYRVIEENEAEKRVSINITGPYEYDLEEMNGMVITEAYVRDGGRGPLGPDYFTGTVIYGKVSVEYIGNEDGAEFTVKEYGDLDDLALQGVISTVSVLQPAGWEDFIAFYTELKDAQEPNYSAQVNLEGDALTEVDDHPEEGYSYAFFTIGPVEQPAAPAAALGEAAYDDEIEAILSGMTLEEKVGQMMLVSFRAWKQIPEADSEGTETVENAEEEVPAVNVTELIDPIRECLENYHFGGTVLFAENCVDAEQVLRLVADMQAANQSGGGLPLLVAADQEGGSINRLGFGTAGPGNMALAATGDGENARVMAAIYGEEMGLLGINADFAPVVDVNSNPNNPVIGVRAFSDDPQVVSDFGGAFIDGLHDAGTIATAKHFPGHGNTNTDSHTGLPLIDRSYEALKAQDLIPFKSAIDAGADMVMTAHIQFPQIENETYTSVSTGEEICLPATMSKTLLTDILRGDMGFSGVIVADALSMASITDNFTDGDMLRLTIEAGVDMLILPGVWDSEQFRHVKDMTDMAVELVRNGEIDEARIDESVRRILTLKKKYGLLDQTDFTVTSEQVEAAVSGVGSTEHRHAAWDIAEKALTLVKNNGDVFPVQMQDGETALILFADSCASRAGTGELAVQMLSEQGVLPHGAEITVMTNDAENGEDCVKAATEADHVILVNRVYNSACLDPNTGDGFSTAVFDQIIEARHGLGKPVIVVSCQLPYDAARFTDADAILLTYGGGVMRAIPPTEGAGSAYAPNLAAGLCACFGAGAANGRLPVNLPALDGDYRLTGDILYKAGAD